MTPMRRKPTSKRGISAFRAASLRALALYHRQIEARAFEKLQKAMKAAAIERRLVTH